MIACNASGNESHLLSNFLFCDDSDDDKVRFGRDPSDANGSWVAGRDDGRSRQASGPHDTLLDIPTPSLSPIAPSGPQRSHASTDATILRFESRPDTHHRAPHDITSRFPYGTEPKSFSSIPTDRSQDGCSHNERFRLTVPNTTSKNIRISIVPAGSSGMHLDSHARMDKTQPEVWSK
ncbi:hypothetical protein M427DRAFT_386897 [Gonapodya prolifera JEL478]|uniref:Uncharacterized protein n=1 Tax=Gonapodya prolifera (strain JEL478) TaxID=1344416 RepID=A0A139A8Y4_GONPJ|nr:hypothetical protein M427DRAFT_386897 [Gonapodya prolifera JEL478]|eukprot:KXS12925.1 hypothetical protein M427DRAFT_386897 [Gonapodya prolifera JEL478]